jgi:hypothetical protein
MGMCRLVSSRISEGAGARHRDHAVIRLAVILLFVFAATVQVPVGYDKAQAAGGGQSFQYLQSPFTQEIFGVADIFMGGVAFAPDGDAWVDFCWSGPGDLYRFDAQSFDPPMYGTNVHAVSSVQSTAGCGLTNHPNGSIYSNTFYGAAQIDAATGTPIAILGEPGNSLGITVDPQTNHVVYVGMDCRFTATCTIFDLDPVTGVTVPFAIMPNTVSDFADGLYFDPTGNFLFMANRSPAYFLTVFDRAGNIVQNISMDSEPDGVAFHATSPKFVVTNNTDGTVTRFDFPNDDYTASPTISLFASGGFRGDLSQVGPDGCLYLSQDSTRFDDGTEVGNISSLVRICGGFAVPPGVTQNQGHVTGGGWITSPSGAYAANSSAQGKANFGFVAKSQKNSSTPSGNIEFQLQSARLNFHSESYESLAVTGSHAQFTGVGTINGSGNYGFTVTVDDGSPDTFRIQIWDKATNAIVYDNGSSQPISNGSIVIHKI